MERRGIIERVVMGADLPGEAIPGQPLVEIAGEHRVLIENHRGVVGYGTTEICVSVKFGYLKICGSMLMLSRMTKQQIVISGNIDSVSLCRR